MILQTVTDLPLRLFGQGGRFFCSAPGGLRFCQVLLYRAPLPIVNNCKTLSMAFEGLDEA